MLAHLKPLKERDFLLGNIATHYAVSRKNSSLHFFGNKSSTYKFRSRLSSYAFWRFYIWCGLLSVTRFPQQCSCNIPSERTRIGHTGADLCHRPPQGINHSLRSFSAIKVSVFEKKKLLKLLSSQVSWLVFVVEKQKLKIHKTNFLAEKVWRLRFRWGCCHSLAHLQNVCVTKARAH